MRSGIGRRKSKGKRGKRDGKGGKETRGEERERVIHIHVSFMDARTSDTTRAAQEVFKAQHACTPATHTRVTYIAKHATSIQYMWHATDTCTTRNTHTHTTHPQHTKIECKNYECAGMCTQLTHATHLTQNTHATPHATP